MKINMRYPIASNEINILYKLTTTLHSLSSTWEGEESNHKWGRREGPGRESGQGGRAVVGRGTRSRIG